ncbi:CHRD domain-containing protein [cf. Phormidesmis sp. LEGE 11477]|uniref:CHRD domain-containing protein n=1 Tax=cf. Phormidesmis sp. LEGE 11477 TaxID=1828680 RepID=UPI00187FF161|nr:CHRD domain-containing protein [cf. Phormidesmis sp. LEGE 11477]MBE9059658.1 CHRD domain-containing protein [cf. Phormidesmis sp. LEGE 11477]
MAHISITERVPALLTTAVLPLEESQQTAPVIETASTGSFVASLEGNVLRVSGEFSQLTSPLLPVGGVDPSGNPESPVHIHIGEMGANGPIIRNLRVIQKPNQADAGRFTGVFKLSDSEVAGLIADGLYVNLHTQNNPSGELRGQVNVESSDLISSEVLATGLPLEEAQQPTDVVDTASTGELSVSLNGNKLIVLGNFSDLTSPLLPIGGADAAGNPESPVHIHMAAAGENGPIIRNLTVDEAGGDFSGIFTLEDSQVDSLLADGLYVNLHTQANPSGELRSQLNIDSTDLGSSELKPNNLPLEESQQTSNVVDTASTGNFSATLNGNRLVVLGSFDSLTSPLLQIGGVDPAGNPESAVHIHIGEAGENGPIIRNLTVDEADGKFSGAFDLSNRQVEVLIADGLYVNLHTQANPSGELRGQIDVALRAEATAGDDTVLGSNGKDVLAGLAGNDIIKGFGGRDILRGDGDSSSPQAGKPGGDDIIFGGAGKDMIGGKGGNDILYGGSGQDKIYGDGGNDILRGGKGKDTLFGDTSRDKGSDTFVLARGEGRDNIMDFEVGRDLIGLADGLTFADLLISVRSGSTIISTDHERLATLKGVDEVSESLFVVFDDTTLLA